MRSFKICGHNNAERVRSPTPIKLSRKRPMMVPGRIHYTRWTDRQDVERFGVEIIANEVTSLSYGKSRQQQGSTQDNEDDDIPF